MNGDPLHSLLRTRWLGRHLRRLERCRSTNDEAAAWAREGAPSGSIVVAEEQTGGRGRLGRTWHSPPGENLYFSAVLRPPLPPHRAPPITLAVAVAVAEAVESLGIEPELKWPNDLLVDGRKLCGILTEMTLAGGRIDFVIVGIGVNLHALAFPPELRERATSLRLLLGHDPDGERFVAELCLRLERWCERYVAEGAAPVVAAWKQRARLFGREVTVSGGREPVRGVAEDLDEDGALILRRPDGSAARVLAGEVS